jgi:Rad3-related DNA helicase
VGYALASKEPTLIITWTKGLMDQYMSMFSSIGMTELRGRDNYPCHMYEGRDDYSCEDGYPARCPYRGTVGCPYSLAEIKMATSRLGVTNYAKWTSAGRLNPALGHFTQVVFDEGHHMPEAVANAMQVVLQARKIEEILGIDFPRGMDREDLSHWKAWATEATGPVEQAMLQELDKVTGNPDPKLAWIRHYVYLRNLLRKLTTLRTLKPSAWIVEETDYGFVFDVISPGRYGESSLLLGVNSVIAMSATLRPKTLHLSGIQDFLFEEFPSDFDPRRSPVYYIPTVRVDARAKDLSELWVRMDQFMARWQNHKGIIDPVSFDRQKTILEQSRFRQFMIVNQRGSSITKAVERYRRAKPGAILVSPSIPEGFDFPDAECRWQIMAKIPFEPLTKIVKARQDADREYRGHQALQHIIQFFGRGVRSKGDWRVGAIFDRHLDWFWAQHKHLAPEWFHSFFQASYTIPAPLDLDGEGG